MFDDIIMHVGVGHDDSPPGRGSGRYGWGTGDNPGQHQFNFLSEVESMRKDGFSDLEIAKTLLGDHARAVDLKTEITIYKNEQKTTSRAKALEMIELCNGNVSEAARRLGMKNESSLRSLIDPVKAANQEKYKNTADILRKAIEEKGIIDVSSDVNLHLGVAKNTMDVAVRMLEKEGYVRSYVKIPQLGTNNETSVRVLAPKGMTYGEIQKSKFDINSPVEFASTKDQGLTFEAPKFPTSLDSKRIYVRYKDEGGLDKDGVIELRPGVPDLSLGETTYSQVRIAVDGTHYAKGMAMYSNNIPEGYDVVINSNKDRSTPLIGKKDHEVLKRLKINEETGEVDKDNPFGAMIKMQKERDGIVTAGGQRYYTDENGNKKLSPINKVNDEGDWNKWSKNLSSQFLAKQPLKLINQQLDLTIKDKKLQLDEINNLTNPVVKKKMLNDYADECDALASSLKAKGFKNQSFQVLLPVPSLKNTEVYAPNYKDGDTVALVRYPHAGLFEIPILKVNNKNKEGKTAIGNSKDAIGINPYVAETLSGADFDGDAAVVIPMGSNNIKIKNAKRLKELEGFDAKSLYKLPDSAPRMKNKTKQQQMGIVTNLITDMTIGGEGASLSEIARAVKHSMVVIDAEKHHLDYKQSEKDNNIEELKAKYQNVNSRGKAGGASTILSRASSTIRVNDRKEITNTKIMTPEELERWNSGKKVYRDTGKTLKVTITDPKEMTPEELKIYNAGKKVYRDSKKLKTIEVSRMSNVDDAFDLVRDKQNPKEVAYANYANNLKNLANSARITSRSIKPEKVNPVSKQTYAKEVKSLNKKLEIAKSNSPKERAAQALANKIVSQKKKSNPGMDYETLKKTQGLAIVKARSIVGAKKEKIEITDKEWEAIQSNAISTNKLIGIINNANPDKVKNLATPKEANKGLSNSQISMAKAMAATGMYTNKEIAERFNVSLSTITNAIS